jgi:Flp pilus assembly protein TadD
VQRIAVACGAGLGGTSIIQRAQTLPTVAETRAQAQDHVAAGRWNEAESIYRLLVSQFPDAADAWGWLGLFYLDAGRPADAVEPLTRATALEPGHGGYHGALGYAAMLTSRRAEAIAAFRRALEIGPPKPELHNNLALALEDAGQHDEALMQFDAALAMQPDFQDAIFNRGKLLLRMGRFADAAATLEQCVSLAAVDAAAHCHLGMAYFNLARFDAAMASFERALALEPRYADARRNRGLLQFLRGDYVRGWSSFAARIEGHDFAKRHPEGRLWDGSPLAGRALCVYAEEGLGDVLQFVRYLPLAAQSAARVWFEPYEQLRPLLAHSGLGSYLYSGDAPPAIELYLPLMSLAQHLPDGSGRPYWAGAYLSAEPSLAATWGARIAGVTGLKVGIVWAGSPIFPLDRARSAGLAAFEPLARVAGVQLVCLQKGNARGQLADSPWRSSIVDLGDQPTVDAHAFCETAAIIENLDLVISVDTAVGHLAGAMGKPVWLALPYVPDWRWLHTGETTAWYPTMRLFRQTSPGDWAGVFERMAGALSARTGSP